MKALFELIKHDNILVNEIYKHLVINPDDREPDGYLHPSECSSLCPRRNFIGEHFPLERKRGKKEYLALRIGKGIHYQVEKLLKETGLMEPGSNEVPAERDGVRGTADGVLIINGKKYVLEIKSIKDLYYKLYSKVPYKPHVRQLQLYMWMLGIHEGILLYVNKETSELAEHLIQFDQSIVDGILSRAKDDKFYRKGTELPPFYCKHEVMDEWCPLFRYKGSHGEFCEALTQASWREDVKQALTKKKKF